MFNGSNSKVTAFWNIDRTLNPREWSNRVFLWCGVSMDIKIYDKMVESFTKGYSVYKNNLMKKRFWIKKKWNIKSLIF